jgi:hypothetical protein
VTAQESQSGFACTLAFHRIRASSEDIKITNSKLKLWEGNQDTSHLAELGTLLQGCPCQRDHLILHVIHCLRSMLLGFLYFRITGFSVSNSPWVKVLAGDSTPLRWLTAAKGVNSSHSKPSGHPGLPSVLWVK